MAETLTIARPISRPLPCLGRCPQRASTHPPTFLARRTSRVQAGWSPLRRRLHPRTSPVGQRFITRTSIPTRKDGDHDE